MALTLVARALLRPGDAVAVEQLGYRPAWEAFRAAGATVVPVPIDRDGIDVDALTRLASRTTLRAVYVTPHHQYPTTVTLKAARRLALLALARRPTHRDHRGRLRPRVPLRRPPRASAGQRGPRRACVVYIGTLSKILAPGPPHRLRRRAAARCCGASLRSARSLDIQGDLATEAAVATLIEDGELQRHVARVRRVYASRREILAGSLRRTFGDGVEFTPAPGGMALWVRLRMSVDVEAWARPQRPSTASPGTPAGGTPSMASPSRLRDSALRG